MPFNGSGTFTVYTPGNPIANGDTSNATYFNNTMTDFATGLSNTMTKDGQGVPTANIPMGNNKLTGLANGTASTDAANYGQTTTAALGTQAYLTSVSGTNTITASLTGLTAYAAGLTVRFTAAGANTGAVTLNIGSLGAIAVVRADGVALATGDLLTSGTYEAVYDGTSFKLQGSVSASQIRVISGLLFGCTLSTAGSSATMSIAAGQAADSTNVAPMSLASSISKTTSSWAVGTSNGGLDTGSIANSTWYHFYVIRRPDTGVVDVVFSANATTPALPTNYTQYRRIGSGLTNGSAQWSRFTQMGDLFEWYTPIKDIEASNPGTTAVTRTLSVPTGVSVVARLNAGINSSSVAVAAGLYLSALDTEDLAASTSVAPLWGSGAEVFDSAGGSRRSYTQQFIRTNTSAQIRSRVSSSDANVTVRIVTLGWTDTRGKDA